MDARDTIRSAWIGISIKKGRSLLTMLGIIIGVGSVVLMTAIGASMEGVILGQISSIGSNSMVIFPGSGEGGPSGVATAGFDSLTFGDIEALENLETVTSIAPSLFIEGSTRYGREEILHTVVGTNKNFFANQSMYAVSGRLLDDEDQEKVRFVAVLAPDSARKLFGDADPIDKRLTIAGRTFTVVGVLNSVGTQFFQNMDERVYVPLAVAKSVTGRKYVNYLTMQTVYGFGSSFEDVYSLLRQRHQIDNPEGDTEKDDFSVSSSEQANEILGTVSLGLTLFISMIAAISLIVGGIGIMNIMLVAVTERTREIGLRKAVGATARDILLQFLYESLALTVLGGLIGMAGGLLLAALISLLVHGILSTYVFALSPAAMVMALIMAAVTGLLFGIYPARKAAALSPIEALRYE